MEWINSNKDLVGISLALLAVLVSLSTVVISRRNAQANSFLAIQSIMLSADLQRGRLLIYRAIDTGESPPRDSDEAYLMVRALAVFDLLGAYARRRIVRRKWVIDFWHARLQLLRHWYASNGSESTISFYPLHGRPDLLDLITQAERYQCDRSCCTDGQRERRLQGAPSRAADGDPSLGS